MGARRNEDRIWPWLALLLVALIVFGRCPRAFSQPLLFAEDGTRLFAYYFDHRDAAGILRPYAGYTSFLPNLVGWLTGAMPIPWQPRLLSGFAGVAAVVSLAVFASRRFAHVLPSDRLRLLVCGLAAVNPLGNFRMVSVAMYAHWSLLLFATMLAVARPPRAGVRRMVETGVLMACIASHPLSILLLPIYAVRAVKASQARCYFAVLGMTTLAYQLCGVEQARAELPDVATILDSAFALWTQRVIVEPWLGPNGRLVLTQLVGAGIVAVAATIAWVAIVAAAWQVRQRTGAVALGLGAVAAGLTLAVATARPEFLGLGDSMLGQRYAYVQKTLVYVVTVGLILRGFAGRGAAELRGAIALLLVHALAMQIHNGVHYRTDPDDGLAVANFCQGVDAWLDEPSDGAVDERRLFRHGGWSIVLRRRRD